MPPDEPGLAACSDASQGAFDVTAVSSLAEETAGSKFWTANPPIDLASGLRNAQYSHFWGDPCEMAQSLRPKDHPSCLVFHDLELVTVLSLTGYLIWISERN